MEAYPAQKERVSVYSIIENYKKLDELMRFWVNYNSNILKKF